MTSNLIYAGMILLWMVVLSRWQRNLGRLDDALGDKHRHLKEWERGLEGLHEKLLSWGEALAERESMLGCFFSAVADVARENGLTEATDTDTDTDTNRDEA